MESQQEIGRSVLLAGFLIEKFEEGGLSRQLLEQLGKSKEALFKMIEAGTKELGIEVFYSVFFGEPVGTFILEVPENYNIQTCFHDFKQGRDNRDLLAQRVDGFFNDETFPGASFRLTPSRRYEVVMYPIKNSIPYRVALEFALFKQSLLTGAPGLLAILQYAKENLPTNTNIVAIDYEKFLGIHEKKSFSIFIRDDKYVHFNFKINANVPSHHSLHRSYVVPIFKLIS